MSVRANSHHGGTRQILSNTCLLPQECSCTWYVKLGKLWRVKSEQVYTSAALPADARGNAVLRPAFASGPSWFAVWICLHIQMRPHWKSFHLFFNCTFLPLPQDKNHSYRKSGKGILHSLWDVQGRLGRSCRRKEKVILIVLILQMIYHIQIYAEIIHNYLSLSFSRNVCVCLGEY